ncbi:MAG: hypothetical protein JF628_03010 [Sphingomonas sp.]|nr:hypothetical protein [Sphingomonas sp.]
MTGAGTIAKPIPAQLGDEPVFAFGRERRMHARAYDYWVSLLDGRRMPRVRDMDQRKMTSFADRSVLIDLPERGGSPVIAYLGEELRTESEIVAAHPTIADIASGTLLGELLRRFSDIVAHEAPVGFEAEFAGRADTRLLHRGILLPFSDDAGRLSAVYGVISWKQVAAVESTPDIAAAIGSVTTSRPSAPGPRSPRPIARAATPASMPRSAPLMIICSRCATTRPPRASWCGWCSGRISAGSTASASPRP